MVSVLTLAPGSSWPTTGCGVCGEVTLDGHFPAVNPTRALLTCYLCNMKRQCSFGLSSILTVVGMNANQQDGHTVTQKCPLRLPFLKELAMRHSGSKSSPVAVTLGSAAGTIRRPN